MKSAYGAYANIRNAAWQVILDFNIRTVPINLIRIANDANISIIKNSFAKVLKENELGLSALSDGNWYIIYDDTVIRGRARFTIAHELGHIFMAHPLKEGRCSFSREIGPMRPETEREADMFAARLLTPACVAWGLELQTAEDIAEVFDISLTAARYRAERLKLLRERKMFLTSPLERAVFNQFKDFINGHR